MGTDRGIFNQILATCIVNLIGLSHGAALGWVSPFLPLLMSPQSPLDTGAITVDEGSWIGSILCLGAFFGCFLFGYMVERVGIKRTIHAIALPHTVSWVFIYFGRTVYHLYASRFMAGLSGGGIIVAFPLFVADISDKKIRGILGSMIALTSNGGILLMYVAGGSLSYRVVPMALLGLPLLFVLLMFFIPETPQTLLKLNRITAAERSLMFYRGQRSALEKSPDFTLEFENLKNFVRNSVHTEEKIGLRDFLSGEAKLGMFIGLFLMFLNQFSGVFTILTYAASIFGESGSSLSPNASTIIMGAVQILGTLSSFVFVDLAGRKVLLLFSTFGTGLGLLALATYSYMSHHGFDVTDFSWLPVVTLSTTLYLFSTGLSNIPFFVLPEILPTKICYAGNTISMISITIFSFVSLKIFPAMLEAIQLYGAMGIYASVCFVGAAVIMLVVPETKGKNLVQMQNDQT